MATKIVTKNSSTASAAPTASDLVQGELAVNVTDKRLYTENASGAIVELGTSPSTIDINAGTIDGTVIGGATPAAISGTTGAFSSTVDASSFGVDVTGTGNKFLSLSVSGTATGYIGTTYDADGLITGSAQGDMLFRANAKNIIFSTDSGSSADVTIDSSGNVGLGVVPSAFLLPNGSTGALQLQSGGLLSAYNTNTYLSQNWYYNAGEKYIANGSASRYAQTGAEHVWSSAANNTSGAGAGITWSEAMRIDASGNLLVGVTSAQDFDSTTTNGHTFYGGSTNVALHSRNNANPLALQRTGNDGSICNFFKDGAPVGTIGALGANLLIGNGDTGLRFAADNNAIHPWNTTSLGLRDAAIDLGADSIRFKDLYLSGGVYLGGTGAANKLSDFEFGTWTPTVTSSGGTITSVTSQIGTYTKIGRLVTLQYQFNIATLGTASGNCIISGGIPFTEDNSAISYYAGVHRARSGTSSITEFDPAGTLQLYGTTPVAGVYLGSMVYNTTA